MSLGVVDGTLSRLAGHGLFRGTTIDDTLSPWQWLAEIGPPMDAAPLNYSSWCYMISLGVVGMGYPVDQVSTRFLVLKGWPGVPVGP
jgi:hypothetical protein